MSVLELVQYNSSATDLDTLPTRTISGSSIIGIHVENPSRVQLTKAVSDNNPADSTSLGPPTQILRLQLNTQAEHVLQPGFLAAAPIVEYARNFFEASRVTPEFQAKVEADFAQFNDIYMPCTTGELGHFTGWTIDTQEHDGKQTRSFILVRGWRSMADFTRTLDTEEYKEAIPILFAWGAPFEMRHVRNIL